MSVAPLDIVIKVNVVLRGDPAIKAAQAIYGIAKEAGARIAIDIGGVPKHDATPDVDEFDEDKGVK